MIQCDNCGFGHRTFEELRACRPWSEIQAELPCTCGHRLDQHPNAACAECRCNEFKLIPFYQPKSDSGVKP